MHFWELEKIPTRAEFHTQAKAQNRNLSNIQSKSQFKEQEKHRKIIFIGHSATWLPLDQIKHFNTENSANEGNKKIVFVGHSATWIPASPSKQKTSPFSTSAFQLQSKENTSKFEKISSATKKCDTSEKTDLKFDFNASPTETNNKNSENTKKDIETQQNVLNLKKPLKIVKSMAVVDKIKNEIKIVNIENEKFQKNKENLKDVNREELLNAIKNFELSEGASDDLILSVPSYTLNKFITTIDPNSISTEIETIVNQLEKNATNNENIPKKLEKEINCESNMTPSEIGLDCSKKTLPIKKDVAQVLKSKKDQLKAVDYGSVPEEFVVYDEALDKLKVVSSKENPEIIKEANRQNKTLEALQAETISNYALKHWFDSDSKKAVLKEAPMIKNQRNSNLSIDLQKKIEEIREYADKMSRWSSTATSTFAEENNLNLNNSPKKLQEKPLENKNPTLNNIFNKKFNGLTSEKELIFIGSMCYWLPKSEKNINSKILEPDSFSNSLNRNETNDVILGDNVLSRIVIKDNRKYSKGKNLLEFNSNFSKVSSKKNFKDKSSTDKDVVESFGIPVKHNKENIQLKEVSFQSDIKPVSKDLEQNIKASSALEKSKYTFQAAQLEKNTEKYSSITNASVKGLNHDEVKKSFEPVRVIRKPISISKSETAKEKTDFKPKEEQNHSEENEKMKIGNMSKEENLVEISTSNKYQIKELLRENVHETVKSADTKRKEVKPDKLYSPILNKASNTTLPLSKSQVNSTAKETEKNQISSESTLTSQKVDDSLIANKGDKPTIEITKTEPKNRKKPKNLLKEESILNTAVAKPKIVSDQFPPVSEFVSTKKNNIKNNVSKITSNSTFSSTWSKLETKTKPGKSNAGLQEDIEKFSEKSENGKDMKDENRKGIELANDDKLLAKPEITEIPRKDKKIVLSDESTKKTEALNLNREKPNTSKILSKEDLSKNCSNNKREQSNEIVEKSPPLDKITMPLEVKSQTHEKLNKIEQDTYYKLGSQESVSIKNNNSNRSFILVKENTAPSDSMNSKSSLKDSSQIDDVKVKFVQEKTNSKIPYTEDKTDTIILGPPKSDKNRPAITSFVLVNTTNQTFSVAEPLEDKKSAPEVELLESRKQLSLENKYDKSESQTLKKSATNSTAETTEKVQDSISQTKLLSHKGELKSNNGQLLGNQSTQDLEKDAKSKEIRKSSIVSNSAFQLPSSESKKTESKDMLSEPMRVKLDAEISAHKTEIGSETNKNLESTVDTQGMKKGPILSNVKSRNIGSNLLYTENSNSSVKPKEFVIAPEQASTHKVEIKSNNVLSVDKNQIESKSVQEQKNDMKIQTVKKNSEMSSIKFKNPVNQSQPVLTVAEHLKLKDKDINNKLIETQLKEISVSPSGSEYNKKIKSNFETKESLNNPTPINMDTNRTDQKVENKLNNDQPKLIKSENHNKQSTSERQVVQPIIKKESSNFVLQQHRSDIRVKEQGTKLQKISSKLPQSSYNKIETHEVNQTKKAESKEIDVVVEQFKKNELEIKLEDKAHINEPKSPQRQLKDFTIAKEDLSSMNSTIGSPKDSSKTSKLNQRVTSGKIEQPLNASTQIRTSMVSTNENFSKESAIHKPVPTAMSSIVDKNLEEICRKNGILKAESKGKSEPINFYIFSYPETQKLKLQLAQPKLIVDQSLPNRFSIDKQEVKPSTKNVANDIPALESKIDTPKNENHILKCETTERKPELLKTLSPLERMCKKVDKKLDQIQNEIAAEDSKSLDSIKTSVADPHILKEYRENFKTSAETKIVEKYDEKSFLKDSTKIEKNLNPKLDDENIIRKTYIPFSYYLSRDQPKSKQDLFKTEKPETRSPFLDLSFFKNYIKEKPKNKINEEKSESIFKQVTNMIKEELFTYQEVPKETGKKTVKLTEESCASQPIVDGNMTIKPGIIYDKVKKILKEDSTTKSKHESEFVISKPVTPAVAQKIQSILDDTTKSKSDEKPKSKTEFKEIQKSENSLKDVRTLQEDAAGLQKKNVGKQKAETASVAYAETSVVPESVIEMKSPLGIRRTSEISGNVQDNVKTFSVTGLQNNLISKVKSEESAIGRRLNVTSNKDLSLQIENEAKPIAESIKQSVKDENMINLQEHTINKSKMEEEELYKILGITNEKTTKSDKVSNLAHKPSESVMDRIRNYLSKEDTKPKLSSIGGESLPNKLGHASNKELVTEAKQSIETRSNSHPSTSKENILSPDTIKTTSPSEVTNKNSINSTVTEPKTEISDISQSDKIFATDKFKNFLRNDSNNNSPYHMIKPLSLLEHLSNIDTEQVKIDYSMKLLTDSRSNSITNIETSKSKAPLLQAIENDEVLLSPNPELLAKVSVSLKEKSLSRKKNETAFENSKIINDPVKPNVINKESLSSLSIPTSTGSSNEDPKKIKENKEEEEQEEEEVKNSLEKEEKYEVKKNLNESAEKIEQKLSDVKNETKPLKRPFSKDSVKPLDKSRSEPINIIESPGPNILDIEINNDKNKPKKQEKKDISGTSSPLNNVKASTKNTETDTKTQMSNIIPDDSKVQNVNDLTASNILLKEQTKQIENDENLLEIKKIDFAHKQKFIKPSRPLMKELKNVAKSNRNISSSVLNDFKVEMDRYNSMEATPEDKNKIVLKIKYLTKIEPTASESSSKNSTSDSVNKNESNNEK